MKSFLRPRWLVLYVSVFGMYWNFSTLKLPAMSKAARDINSIAPPPPLAPALPPTPADPTQQRYVKIEGRLYKYNPRNTYTVNNVPMLYANGRPRTMQELIKDEGQAKTMKNVNPLMVYTPGGMQKAIDGAQEAAEELKKRVQALDKMSESR